MRFPREDVSLQWKRRLVGEPVTNRKPLASGAGFIVASIMSGLVRGRLATSVPFSVAKLPSWMMRTATRTECRSVRAKAVFRAGCLFRRKACAKCGGTDHSDAYAARTTHSERKSKLRDRHRLRAACWSDHKSPSGIARELRDRQR